MSGPDRIVIGGLSDDEQTELDFLWDKFKDHRDKNLIKTLYYEGERYATFMPFMAPIYRRLGAVLGWSTKAVDMLARRCTPERFLLTDGRDLDELDFGNFAEENRLYAEIKSALISSLIHGVSFLINVQGEDDEPDSILLAKDALTSTGSWNMRKRRLDSFLSINEWDKNEPERPTDITIYMPGEVIDAQRDGGSWEIVNRVDHGFGIPVEPLVYRPRVGKPLGTTRISAAMRSIQDRALRAIVRMEGHMDVYSIPQMIIIGATEGLFKNPDGSQKAEWQIALGRVLGIPDDPNEDDPALARARVEHIEASSPEPHLKNLRQLAMEFSGEASIPLTSLGISDLSNPTSADSYIASREDLISEAEGATDDWTYPVRRAVARGLAIWNGERTVPEDYRSLELRWRNPVHLTRAAQADAGLKQLTAVPWLAETEVGLELLGLSEPQRRQALAERRRAQARQTLDQLVSMAAQPQLEPADEADLEEVEE